MKYNLCIDIGNTNIKSGFFLEDQMFDLAFGVDELREKAKNRDFRSIICSVRKSVPYDITAIISSSEKHIELSPFLKIPINIVYDTPETLGMDRVAAAMGAKKYFPEENCIVIDAGTCITSDFVDKNYNFLGGNISPGISMRIAAMHHFTAALPLVKIKKNSGLLGKNTKEALQNGALKGTIWEISSFIKQINRKYGKSRVIFTGGDTKYFVNSFKTSIFANPNLVLEGLNEILKTHED